VQQDVLQAPLFTQTNLPPGTHHVTINDTSTATLSIASLDVDRIALILGDGDATYVPSLPVRDLYPDPAPEQHTNDLNHAGRYRRQLHLLARLGLVPEPFQRLLPELDDAVRPPLSRTARIADHRPRSRVNTPGVSATLSFWGTHVELYGASSYNHGLFSVALDGAPALVLNASAPVFRPQTLLYMSSGLPDGPHTLVVASTELSVFFDIDYAVVRAWSAPPPVS
jgi:hypothetical protein